ncbi:MAG: hypothetical protein IJ730_01545 [Alphaproteobacteria bacterium]|nr:hypothetical protein [Alphaproteobacteria bacterium]
MTRCTISAFLFLLSFNYRIDACEVLKRITKNSLPDDVVTLTRIPVSIQNNEALVDDKDYCPITACEAFTVFAIGNLFLGSDPLTKSQFSALISKASGFDKKQFNDIQEKLHSENHEAKLNKILLEDLSQIFPEQPDLIERIIRNKQALDINLYANINIRGEEIIRFKLKVDTMPAQLSLLEGNQKRKMLSSNFINNVIHETEKNDEEKCKKIHKSQNIQGTIECFLLKANIDYKKIQPLIRAIANNRQENERLKQSYFGNNPLLFGYLRLEQKDIDYYWELYESAVSKVKPLKLTEYGICMFVANELFFGKNFVLPIEYTKYIPPAPENILSCLNFLLSIDKEIPGEAVREIKDPKRFNNPGTFEDYAEYKKRTESFGKFFRSVSYYKLGEKELQRYTKSSYLDESSIAINAGGYAYLFGIGKDIGELTKLISTQICYDLSCGARASQKEEAADIHIIQSNRLEISSFLEPNQSNIPGYPRVIIHADPSWQEVYIPYISMNLDLSKKEVRSEKRYSRLPIASTFTFSIEKPGYKDAYTITHWIINPSNSNIRPSIPTVQQLSLTILPSSSDQDSIPPKTLQLPTSLSSLGSSFEIVPTKANGNCGYEALGINRTDLSEALSKNLANELVTKHLDEQIAELSGNEKELFNKIGNTHQNYIEYFIKKSVDEFDNLMAVQKINSTSPLNPVKNYLTLGTGEVIFTLAPNANDQKASQQGLGIIIASFLGKQIYVITAQENQVVKVEKFSPESGIPSVLKTSENDDPIWIIVNNGAHIDGASVLPQKK